MLTIDDFIMLGKTVPEPQSDGRVFVCSAGWSDTLQMVIRVYPLSMYEAPAKWTVSQITLERNPRDCRFESFAIAGCREPKSHSDINRRFSVKGKLTQGEKESLVNRIDVISKRNANDQRRSLAVIQPDAPPTLLFDENSNSPDHPQMSLFPDSHKDFAGASSFPFQPRLKFTCEGAEHNLQMREWGSYEWLRKNGAAGVKNHPLRKTISRNPALLIGNMNNQRNSWLVISELGSRTQGDLFLS